MPTVALSEHFYAPLRARAEHNRRSVSSELEALLRDVLPSSESIADLDTETLIEEIDVFHRRLGRTFPEVTYAMKSDGRAGEEDLSP